MALLIPSFQGSSTNPLVNETNQFAQKPDQLIMSARLPVQALAPEQQADSLLRIGAISPYSNIQFNQLPFPPTLPAGEKYQLTGIFPSNASNFLSSGNQQQKQQQRG
jgi:hypothetical protein